VTHTDKSNKRFR